MAACRVALLALLALRGCAAKPQLHRQQRGLIEDMFSDLSSGLNQFGHSASVDISRFGQEMRPAVRQVESTLNHAMRQVIHNSNTLLNRYNPLLSQLGLGSAADDRIEQETHEGVDAPAEGASEDPFGGLLGGSSSSALDPLSLFGLMSGRRNNWWDGPNVCVERDVVEEGSEETRDGSDGGPIYMMDMTMTSCRDGLTFHECTTKANTNGRRKTVTVRHECCYGHTR